MRKDQQVIRSQAEIKEMRLNRIYFLLPFLSIALLLLLWFGVSQGESPAFPSPQSVYERFIRLLDRPIMRLSIWAHIWASLQRVFIALLSAWLVGISFGILLGWSPKMNALLGPVFTGFRSVPPLAWIPLITIWFGTGEFPKILIVFIGALMPVVVNTQAGIANVSQLYLDSVYTRYVV